MHLFARAHGVLRVCGEGRREGEHPDHCRAPE